MKLHPNVKLFIEHAIDIIDEKDIFEILQSAYTCGLSQGNVVQLIAALKSINLVDDKELKSAQKQLFLLHFEEYLKWMGSVQGYVGDILYPKHFTKPLTNEFGLPLTDIMDLIEENSPMLKISTSIMDNGRLWISYNG